MKKNDYINGLMGHHAKLMTPQEHESNRRWAFIVAYFCWDIEMPFEQAKQSIKMAVVKRQQGIQS